jgi:hypothetical protein
MPRDDANSGFTVHDEPPGASDEPGDRWADVRPMTAADLLSRDIVPRRLLLRPWLPEAGLAMLYAARGVGKTHLALSVAHAVASGGAALGWRAPAPAPVFYVDGEMPLAALQERYAAVVRGSDAPDLPTDEHLRFLPADAFRDGLPDLATEEGFALLRRCLGPARLVVLDNLSTLVGGRENEADDWRPMQGKLLTLRRAGVSALMVHHAGRNGSARGTSRREDVLDTVINLRRPEDYDPAQGARFVVQFEKARGFAGEDAAPVEATLETDPETGAARWRWCAPAQDEKAAAFRMFAAGADAKAVMEKLGTPKATAYRWWREFREGGG